MLLIFIKLVDPISTLVTVYVALTLMLNHL